MRDVSRTYLLDTNVVWILDRTRTTQGNNDYLEVTSTQRDHYRLSPADMQKALRSNCEHSVSLSDMGKGLLGMPPLDIVENMDQDRFLVESATLMADDPGCSADDTLLGRFEDVVGFVTVEPYTPSLPASAAIPDARDAAMRSMRAYAVDDLGQHSAGWTLVVRDINEYGDDYPRRAAVALVGFGAIFPKTRSTQSLLSMIAIYSFVATVAIDCCLPITRARRWSRASSYFGPFRSTTRRAISLGIPNTDTSSTAGSWSPLPIASTSTSIVTIARPSTATA